MLDLPPSRILFRRHDDEASRHRLTAFGVFSGKRVDELRGAMLALDNSGHFNSALDGFAVAGERKLQNQDDGFHTPPI